MSRFEIEDIVSQDKRGIVFHAHDRERGHTVALRRFFPFGQEGGGLNGEESAAFVIAAERLSGFTHPCLRSVISGAVDPIDGMPFVVAEWIDGAPLDIVLDGAKLQAPHVIGLLRQALEVSLALSEILAEEAVWVETEVDSIFVGSEESGRGFVFWLSPFKWLGAEFGSRKLSAIADLGEELAGWKGKLIGDNTGNGLGAWMKWVRNHPEAGLAQALETLDAMVSGEPAPAIPAPTATAAIGAAVKVKPPSPFPLFTIAATVCLLLAVGGLAYFQWMGKSPNTPPQLAATNQDTNPPVAEPAPAATRETAAAQAPKSEPKPPAPAAVEPVADLKPVPEPVEDSGAIPASKVNEMAAKLAREREIQRTAARAPTPPPAAMPPPQPPKRDFSPVEGELMRKLKGNGPATLTGVVRNVRQSATGKSIYFEFSDPHDKSQIMAVAHQTGYQGEFTVSAFGDLIGKNVRFEGTVFREPSGNQYVKFSSRKRLKVLD